MHKTTTKKTNVSSSWASKNINTLVNLTSIRVGKELLTTFPAQRLIGTLVVAGTLGLMGCNNSSKVEETNTATAGEAAANPNEKSYKVLTDGDGMPFTFRDEQGKVQGFDIDVMNAIAEDQGFSVSYDILPWNTILPSMAENKGDLAIAHISITEERQKIHSYSNPYYQSSQLALVKPNFATATNFAQLKDARISVLKDSITDDLFKGMNIATTPYDKIFPMVKSLVNDEADAMVLDSGIVEYYNKEYAKEGFAIIADESVPKDDYGIVVSKTQPELLTKVNAGLNNIKQNGKYQQIHQKWFAK